MSIYVDQSATPLFKAGIEAVYSGIDWLSCSCPWEAGGRGWWADRARRVIEAIGADGHELEARSLNGYQGIMAGGSFWGMRPDGAYLQLAGHYAGEHFDEVYIDELHISRLDLQVTVRYLTMPQQLGYLAHNQVSNANKTLPAQRRRRIWYMSSDDGGYTLYVGSPSSDQRGRLYNKEVQSEQPIYTRCWRWEVMYRNAFATQIAQWLSERTEEREKDTAKLVSLWYTGRGCMVDWGLDTEDTPHKLIRERPTDADNKLRWLRQQVRPAVTWLRAAGYTREVNEALGFE